MVALDPRASARRRPGAPRFAALEPRRGRRLRDRPEVRRRRAPPGRRLLARGHARGDDRVHPQRVRGPGDGGCRAASAQARRDRPRRQAGRAVVVQRSSPSCAAGRARARATPARSTRSRPASWSLLSGAATRLAPCFVGLDKRYVTDVDLTRDDVDRRPGGRGRRAPRAAFPAPSSRSASRAPRRGRAADPGRVGGQDRRRARLPARAARGRGRDAAAALAGLRARGRVRGRAASVRLDLHVSSGTYVRSLAAALGGHCRTLRRTAVGPFAVEEADPERMLPASEALARLPEEALSRVPDAVREAALALEAEPG